MFSKYISDIVRASFESAASDNVHDQFQKTVEMCVQLHEVVGKKLQGIESSSIYDKKITVEDAKDGLKFLNFAIEKLNQYDDDGFKPYVIEICYGFAERLKQSQKFDMAIHLYGTQNIHNVIVLIFQHLSLILLTKSIIPKIIVKIFYFFSHRKSVGFVRKSW